MAQGGQVNDTRTPSGVLDLHVDNFLISIAADFINYGLFGNMGGHDNYAAIADLNIPTWAFRARCECKSLELGCDGLGPRLKAPLVIILDGRVAIGHLQLDMLMVFFKFVLDSRCLN